MAAWLLFGIPGLTAEVVATVAIGAAISVGTMSYQKSQAKKAESRGRKGAQAAAEAQATAAARARGVAQAPISAEQMQKVIKQRELSSLVDHYAEQEGRGPQVYTLPVAQPSSAVVRINNAIHDFITGAA